MSWEQLADIVAEARAERRREQTEPPVACPNDGEPLLADAYGHLRCRFDGYEYPRDGKLPSG